MAKFSTVHNADDHTGVTGYSGLLDETAHDALDHTGLTGVGGGGSTIVGYAPFAAQVGVSQASAFAATRTLAAVSASNAGAAGALIHVPAPMKLRAISVWNKDTATARTAEGRLFLVTQTSTASFVTGTDCTFSFTPSAASLRSGTVSGAVVDLDPGYYLAVIRNTSASQTFAVGSDTVVTSGILPGSVFITTASVAALGSTIDVTAWTHSGSGIGIILSGEVFGTGAIWA